MEVLPGRVDVGFLPSPGWSVPQPGGDSSGDVEGTILPSWYWRLLVSGDFSGVNLLITAIDLRQKIMESLTSAITL